MGAYAEDAERLLAAVGGSENIVSVEDAMDYLTRTTKGKTRKKGKGESAKAEPKTEEGEKETPSERPLTPEEEENKRLFEDFMRSTFD